MSQVLGWSFLLYLLSIPMCRARRDNTEPIELIPDVEVDSYGTTQQDMANDRPNDKAELQQVYKFIEEKFLSFAALNIRPNFANFFRHMERMSRAFVKLNSRVDAMYLQIEEMKNYQQNNTRNNGAAPLNSIKMTLDELDNKIDNIEKQIHLTSSQGIVNELGHLRQQIFNLETRADFGNEQSRHPSADMQTFNIVNKMNSRLHYIERNLSEVSAFQSDNQKLIQSAIATVHSMNHKFLNTSQELSQLITMHKRHLQQPREAPRDHDHMFNLQKFSNLLHKLEFYQNKSENILEIMKKQSTHTNIPTYCQHDKINELLDIVQDLPSIVTDAVDKVEIFSDKLQERLESDEISSQKYQKEISNVIPKIHKIEINSDHIVNQLRHISSKNNDVLKSTVTNYDDTHIHPLLIKCEEALNTINKLSNKQLPHFKESFSYNISRIQSVLDEMLRLQENQRLTGTFPTSAKTTVSYDDGIQEIQKLIKTNQFTMENQTRMIKTILKEFANNDISTNITLDKLEFITSFLSYFQIDQSNIAAIIDSMAVTVQALNQNNENILSHVKEIKHEFGKFQKKPYMLPLNTGKSNESTLHSFTEHSSTDNSHVGNTFNENFLFESLSDCYESKIRPFVTSATKPSVSKLTPQLYDENDISTLISDIMNKTDNLTLKIDHLFHVNSQLNKNLGCLHNSKDKPGQIQLQSIDPERNFTVNNIELDIQQLYNRSLFNDLTTHKHLESLTEMILTKIQLLMSQSTELQHIKDILNSIITKNNAFGQQSLHRTDNVDGSANNMHTTIQEKFNDLQSYFQKTVDDTLLRIVDVLGQNKLWFQQATNNFIEQQNNTISKLKTSTGTLVSKGFENLQFMYQYLSGKLDKIHQIIAHNLEDCADIQKSGHTVSGVYTIYPRNSKEIRVYCDMESNGVGWTVIQRRGNTGKIQKVSFNQSWIDYKYGFGNLEDEFWLGNENIHTITNQGSYILRIDFVYAQPDRMLPRYKRKFWHDLKNTSKIYAQYAHFLMNNEASNYSINYSTYTGVHPYDGFEGRTGLSFVTFDHYSNNHEYYCAKVQGGGWWYGTECFRFALNSKYKNHYWDDGNLYTGITWGGPADIALLKEVEIKLLPHAIFQRVLGEEMKPFAPNN